MSSDRWVRDLASFHRLRPGDRLTVCIQCLPPEAHTPGPVLDVSVRTDRACPPDRPRP